MGKSLSFDIAALLILTILFVSCILRKMTSGTQNRLFLVFISFTWLATVFDIWAVSLDNANSTNMLALYAAHCGYIIIHNFTVPLYTLFVISLTDTWHKIQKNVWIQAVLWVPYLVLFAALVTNPLTRKMFTVDAGYQRGEWFFLIYTVIAVYMIFVLGYVIYYRELLEFSKTLIFLSYIPIGLTTLMIQMLYPTMLVEMYGAAISLLLISIGVQRPEQIVDSDTQLMKYSAYANVMKRNYQNEKNVDVVMINVANLTSIQAMMGYDFAMHVVEDVVERIRRVNKLLDNKGEMYHLDRGRFRIVYNERYHDRAVKAAEMLVESLREKTDFNELDISLQPYVVLARCPEEITDFKMLMSFGTDFHEKLKYEQRVMHVEDIFHK
ncbi:MAG: hypothetical protein K2N00_08420, partial [Lachnospiraceae bacterium]|nr:hypothetical protein [Lachnospiraceae bacterium]